MDILEMKRAMKALYDQIEEIKSAAAKNNRELDVGDYEKIDDLLDQIEALHKRIQTLEREERLRGLTPGSEIDPPNAGSEDDGENFRSFGEFLQAVALAGSPRGTSIGGKRGGYVDQRLLFEGPPEARATGLSEGVPSDGGFLVGQDFASALITKTYESGLLANRCRKIPISPNSNGLKMNGIDETSRAAGSRWGGIRAYWKGEAAAKTASKPKFRRIELELEKLIGLCYSTDELLQDSTALEAVIMEGFSEEFAFQLDDAIFRGTGAGQPQGFMPSNCLVSVAKETGQAATTIVYENVVKMYARLWARSMMRSVWLCNQDTIPQLFTMTLNVGTGGAPVFLPANGAAGRPYSTIFGRDILFIEQADTLGQKGDIVLADPSQYLLIDKGGIQAASSIHVQFIYDETCFRFVYRVDGEPLWNAALTPYKGTNTVSPFVTLNART